MCLQGIGVIFFKGRVQWYKVRRRSVQSRSAEEHMTRSVLRTTQLVENFTCLVNLGDWSDLHTNVKVHKQTLLQTMKELGNQYPPSKSMSAEGSSRAHLLWWTASSTSSGSVINSLTRTTLVYKNLRMPHFALRKHVSWNALAIAPVECDRKGILTHVTNKKERRTGSIRVQWCSSLGAPKVSKNHVHWVTYTPFLTDVASSSGNFKDVRFCPIFNFGHFWAALSKISGFYPTRCIRQFWADPIFQLFEALFWPKMRPKILNFYPTRNFGHFWAPSLVTLLIFRNVMTREHQNTQTPKHQNTQTPKHPNTKHPNTQTPKHLNT